MLGQALAHDGSGKALGSLRRAYELAPHVYGVVVALGAEQQKWGNIHEAKRTYKQAVVLAPKEPEPLVALGVLMQASGETELDPSGATPFHPTAESVILSRLGDAEDDDDDSLEDAPVAAWSAALTLSPGRADVHALIATRIASSQPPPGAGGEAKALPPAATERALGHAKRAVALAPHSPASYDALGGALLRGRAPANLTKPDLGRVRKALRSAVRLHDDSAAIGACSSQTPPAPPLP